MSTLSSNFWSQNISGNYWEFLYTNELDLQYHDIVYDKCCRLINFSITVRLGNFSVGLVSSPAVICSNVLCKTLELAFRAKP